MGGRAKTAVSQARAMTAVSFAEAMEMVKDEEKAQAFFTKLEGLKAEIGKDYDKSLMIDEIDRLLIQTRDDRHMAGEELENAKVEAKKILAKADIAAQKISDESDARSLARESALKASQAKLARAMVSFDNRMDVSEANLVKRVAAARKMERLSKSRAAEADGVKQRYETALASMKAGVAAA